MFSLIVQWCFSYVFFRLALGAMHQQRRPPKMMFLPKYNQLYRRLGVWQGMPLLKGRTWKDVRQQPAVQFLHFVDCPIPVASGSKVVHLWRSSKMEETAASCATARHQQDWLSIHFVIQFVMVHLERQDLHDRRWWGRCDLRAVRSNARNAAMRSMRSAGRSTWNPSQSLGDSHLERTIVRIGFGLFVLHGDMLYDYILYRYNTTFC